MGGSGTGARRTALRDGWSRGDVAGALTVWALLVPECVAYAQIAGVPPQNAFYAAPVVLLVYALLGRSRFLVVGATSAAAVLSAATVATVAGPGAGPEGAVGVSAALAVLTGAVLVGAGLARLGFVTNFLAEPALVGFLSGTALTIIVRQAAKVAGVPGGEGDFFERAWSLLRRAPDWSPAALAVGAGALVLLLVLERLGPRLPASLVVLALGLVVSAGADLADHGVEVVGPVPAALPVPHLPAVPAEDWAALAGGAFGVALVVFAESFSIADRFARAHGDEVDADREMIAVGASNVAAGLVRGFAVSGSTSRSAAAEAAGSTSRLTSLVAAVLVLLTGAFLTPLFTDLPEPVLGAIVIVAVLGFLRPAELLRYRRLDRPSFWVAMTALVGVLLFDLLPGLFLAVVLSLVLFVASAGAVHVSVLGRLPGSPLYGDVEQHPGAATVPGVLVVRPDGALFFGNVDRARRAVRARVAAGGPAVHAVVLDLGASYRLGVQVLDTLDELREELAAGNVALHLARLRARAGSELDRHRLAGRLAPGTRHASVEDAVTALAPPPADWP
ncbi:SulP family inorganic anion transporter [Streptomyces sp. NPDC059506]|uniref:SulP family inorganic anion transporter n=1 Tax=Streptomyces sp. NPDC059506 TaxID=3347751 RepID=UPI0036AB4D33